MDSTLHLPKMLLPLSSSTAAAAAPSRSTRFRFPPCGPPRKTHRGALPAAASLTFSFARSLLRSFPLPPPSSRFASLSSCPAFSGSGGGGEDGGSSGSEAAAKSLAGEAEDVSAPDADVIVLQVGGMSCGGCAASVRRILESQTQVASATVSFEKSTALIRVVPEVTVEQGWKQELGEKLAKHLTTCGFQSDLQGDYAIGGENKS